ncbi:hypothetical protein PAHAL_5G184800 [Panicum hallii]|uniref:Uncharacterized protein n=1 Tax=Panicum hallii TaxID=206008 RepID=A0A2T8IKD0_9POAL|nr:hypothetical protein PAHAL_5G184800 [Panicum hallii]
MASGPDPPLVVRHLGARHRGPQSTANRLVRRRRGCEVVPPMARRRRKGRKTLRDDLRAAARRTRSGDEQHGPVGLQRRRTRAAVLASRLYVPPAQGTRQLLAAAPGRPSPTSSDGTPAHPSRQTFRPPHLLARSLSASSDGPTAGAANHLGRSRS